MAGRPYKKEEERKKYQYRIRFDKSGWDKLQYLKNIEGFKLSEFFRHEIDVVYEQKLKGE